MNSRSSSGKKRRSGEPPANTAQQEKAPHKKPPNQQQHLPPDPAWRFTAGLTTYAVLAITLVSALSLYLLSFARSFPFYYAFDMDLVTVLDLFYLNSQRLPDHLCHPGLGMNFFLWIGSAIQHSLGVISVLDLAQLNNSLHPLAVMAESTDAIRLLAPVAVLATASLLTLALTRQFDLPPWQVLAIFAVFALSPSSQSNAALIRTECFAVLWWSLAMWAAVEAARSRGLWARTAWLLLTGATLGLSFFTKVQGLFYLLAVPVWLFFSFVLWRRKTLDASLQSRRVAVIVLALAGICSLLFTGLSMAAMRVEPPRGIKTWATGWGTTSLWWCFVALYLGVFITAAVLVFSSKRRQSLMHVQGMATLLLVGSLLPLALHFVFFDSWSRGSTYLLLDLKFALLRHTDLISLPSPSQALKVLSTTFRQRPAYFLLHGIMLMGLLIGKWRHRLQVDRRLLVSLLAIAGLAFVQIAIATRTSGKDLIWQETLTGFASFAVLALLVSASPLGPRITRALSVCALLMLVASSASAGLEARHQRRIGGGRNWQSWVWMRGISGYDANQRDYKTLMARRYGHASDPSIIASARAHRQRLRLARSVLPNLDVNQRALGLVLPGLPAQLQALDTQQQKVPASWRGSLLVDITACLKNRPHTSLRVRPRADIELLLMVEGQRLASFVSPTLQPTANTLVLQKDGVSVEYRGLRVSKPLQLPTDHLGAALLLVRRR